METEERLRVVSEQYEELEKENQFLQKAYDTLQEILKLLITEESGQGGGQKLEKFFELIGGRRAEREGIMLRNEGGEQST
jgi:hypothetical protein